MPSLIGPDQQFKQTPETGTEAEQLVILKLKGLLRSYHLDSVFHLDLSGLKLLPRGLAIFTPNLRFLDCSGNPLGDFRSLCVRDQAQSHWTRLKTILAYGLPILLSLEYMDARENQLDSFDAVSSLSKHLRLKSLRLMSDHGNAVTKEEKYTVRLKSIVPELETIDALRLDHTPSSPFFHLFTETHTVDSRRGSWFGSELAESRRRSLLQSQLFVVESISKVDQHVQKHHDHL